MKVKLEMDKAQVLRLRGLNAGGAAQRLLTNEIARLSKPYIPLRQGVLQNPTKVNAASIEYDTPYARYQYYGKLMVGRAPKKLTGINLDHHGAPMRGPFWDKRMWADRGGEIIDEITESVTGGRRE